MSSLSSLIGVPRGSGTGIFIAVVDQHVLLLADGAQTQIVELKRRQNQDIDRRQHCGTYEV